MKTWALCRARARRSCVAGLCAHAAHVVRAGRGQHRSRARQGDRARVRRRRAPHRARANGRRRREEGRRGPADRDPEEVHASRSTTTSRRAITSRRGAPSAPTRTSSRARSSSASRHRIRTEPIARPCSSPPISVVALAARARPSSRSFRPSATRCSSIVFGARLSAPVEERVRTLARIAAVAALCRRGGCTTC